MVSGPLIPGSGKGGITLIHNNRLDKPVEVTFSAENRRSFLIWQLLVNVSGNGEKLKQLKFGSVADVH